MIVVYFLSFIFIREIIFAHREWVPNRLWVYHNQYNHTLSPNFPPDVIHEDDHDIARDYKINSLGLRENDEIILPKPKKEFRILVVGDSFVMAGLKILDKLETRLNTVYGNDQIVFNIINCGQSSYSPMIHLARLKHQLLGLDPDTIIYLPDLTDVYDDTHRYLWLAKYDEDGKLDRVKPSTRIFRAKRRHKRKINHFLQKIGLATQKIRYVRSPKAKEHKYFQIFDHAKEDEKNPSQYTEQELSLTLGFIKDYIEIARSNKIHLSITMYPHLAQIIPENKVYSTGFDSLYNRLFERRVQELAQKEDILFKSFYEPISQSVLSGKQLYIRYDMHFNDYGYDFLADLVTEWVVRNPKESIGFAP